MADNVESASGSGGPTFASDDIASVHYPRVKLIHGADGTNDGDVSTANPLPADQREIGGVAVPVDDTSTLTSGTTPGNLVMAAATPTDTSVDANDIGAVAMSTDRRLHVDAQLVGQDADITIADGGNSLTVDGTVTANLSATDNAVLDNIQTAVDTVAAAVSTQMQVDVVGALPAGTNAIGKLASNTGVDIGDVDVTSVVPGTGASNLGKAEDAAHTTGDVGVMPLAVRNDDLAALAGTDGDYAPLQVTQNGALLMCPAANDDYKYAVIDDASSGDNTLIAAVTSRKIRVLAAFMVSAGTVNARFEDGAAGTALTGQMNLVANSGFTLPFNPAGWFETSANTLLNLELSDAVSVDGSITYIEVA